MIDRLSVKGRAVACLRQPGEQNPPAAHRRPLESGSAGLHACAAVSRCIAGASPLWRSLSRTSTGSMAAPCAWLVAKVANAANGRACRLAGLAKLAGLAISRASIAASRIASMSTLNIANLPYSGASFPDVATACQIDQQVIDASGLEAADGSGGLLQDGCLHDKRPGFDHP